MRKFFLFYFSLIIPFVSSTQPSDKIDSFITVAMTKKHIPGLALAIIQNNTVVKKFFYGMANLEQQTQVTEKSVFEIASMTKQFTCAAILMLQEEGKLSVTDKVSKYLNDLPPLWNEITVSQLMNHSSGLRDDWNEPTSYFLENNTYQKMFLAQIKNGLYFPPGESFNYSSGPFFLGLVIEKLTGKHYSYYLKERIFNPLKMNATSVYNDTTIVTNRVAGYWWKNNSLQNGVDISPSAESRADVGIITSIDDMVKWSMALKGNSFLSPESKKQMFTPGRLKNGSYIPYGFGWYIYPFRGNVIYEHSGGFRTGFNSIIIFFPEKNLEIVVLCNLWKAGLSNIAYEIASYYLPDFKKVSTLKPKQGEQKKVTNELELLFTNLSNKTYNRGQLYKELNIAGFEPDELAELLKGFKSLQYIEKLDLKSTPIKLYGKNISTTYFYKAIAEKTTYWSFNFSSSNKLVSVNWED
ncbi:MAG TPA: serine hydrolase domain-containing protein [Chitinophagaceae bacterium]|nr:serine hydrolase domain-containing protein [Chitinophagaceae bacterium]